LTLSYANHDDDNQDNNEIEMIIKAEELDEINEKRVKNEEKKAKISGEKYV
jgi:hypothetical protein